jgi:protein SCO1
MRLLFLCLAAFSFLEHGSLSAQELPRARTNVNYKPEHYRGGLVTPPLPKPHFVLTDTSGAPFDFFDRTGGAITLLFFGYTHCPSECPLHMASIGAALKKLPPRIAAQVTLVFVTTDPRRDRRADLCRWLNNFDKRFVGLTGTPAAVDAAQKAARVPLANKTDSRNGDYAVSHANFVVAYTKDNLGHVIYPGGVSEDDWIHDLPLLANETWGRP